MGYPALLYSFLQTPNPWIPNRPRSCSLLSPCAYVQYIMTQRALLLAFLVAGEGGQRSHTTNAKAKSSCLEAKPLGPLVRPAPLSHVHEDVAVPLDAARTPLLLLVLLSNFGICP